MKTKLYLTSILCLSVILLGSCSTGNTLSTQQTPTSTQVESTTPDYNATSDLQESEISATYTPDATPEQNTIDRTQYNLQVDFDYDQHTLEIQQDTTLMNSSQESFQNLLFLIEPNRLGSMELDGITLNGQDYGDYDLESDQLNLKLITPMDPGQVTQVGFIYKIILPVIPEPSDDYKPVPYGYTTRQANLVDWYFLLAPYQEGEGWIAHEPGYYGEFLVYEKGDFDVTINLIGTKTDVTLAGSALFELADGEYHANLKDGRAFAWSASDQYEIATQSVGSVTVASYYFPVDKLAGEQALQNTAQALALYSDLFSPYEHTSLTVVEADFLDGMEYDGLYFLSRGFYNLYDGTPKGYLTAIAVHETSHQWWFGQVGNDQANEPWLDEAMATYSERLYYESTYPDLVDWWWAYRVDYYQPSGWIDETIYNYQGFRSYRDAVYLNGANFLEDLRQTIGDDDFFAFLKAYASTYQDKISTTEGFFDVLSQINNTDLSTLKSQYFLTHP